MKCSASGSTMRWAKPGMITRCSWNEAEREILEANLAARRPFLDFVYSRTNPDGSRQYLMVSGEPMFDSSGRFTGYRGIGKDVTESMLRNYELLPKH